MMSDQDPDPRPRIVIADDHPSVLVALRTMRQRSCDVVATISNGHGAVAAVGQLRPDVLVVDLIMPDLDGLEVCRRVKQVAPDTIIVMVTAFDDTHVRTVAAQVGISAFVPKHAAATTLEPTIKRIVAERHGIGECNDCDAARASYCLGGD